MPNPIVSALTQYFPSFFPGNRLIDGGDLQNFINLTLSAQGPIGLTALAGGGQAGATVLKYAFNRVDVVANAADSVLLPLAIPGTEVFVDNNQAANALQVFGQVSNPNNGNVGDTIASHNSIVQQSTATGVSQPAAVMGIYICTKLGQWKQAYSA
jgi:hypothetical protein